MKSSVISVAMRDSLSTISSAFMFPKASESSSLSDLSVPKKDGEKTMARFSGVMRFESEFSQTSEKKEQRYCSKARFSFGREATRAM